MTFLLYHLRGTFTIQYSTTQINTATFRSRLLLTKSGCLFAYIPSPVQSLVVKTVVSISVCGTLCPTLPQFTKVQFIVQLTCRGTRIVFLSLLSNSLKCREMPSFTEYFDVMVKLLFACQLDKLYHNLANYDYLLVVEIVVKVEFLLLRILCCPLNLYCIIPWFYKCFQFRTFRCYQLITFYGCVR